VIHHPQTHTKKNGFMVKIRLDELLTEKGITLYKLAKDAGLSYGSLHKIRHNQVSAVRLDALDAICEALQCEPGELFAREKEKPSRPSAKKAAKK
jgi:putative transcriptional regulator